MKTNNFIEPPFVVNKGRAVRAVYREAEIMAHSGNPLEEAIPPMLSTDQIILRLKHFPSYDESNRRASDEVRYLLIQNSMRFFAPLDIHIDLYRRFSNLIRIGYAERNPIAHRIRGLTAAPPETFDQYRDQYDVTEEHLASTAAGFNIAGVSGVGKSFSIDRILNLYPQVIHHNNYRGLNFTHSQIVWLKIDCPFDGNPRGLALSFFKTIDAILHTIYRKDYGKSRRLQTELMSDMSIVAGNHFLGVLVIDEIQRLSLAKSGGADMLLNFFVHLVSEIGVPVVLVGTYKALAVLSGEFSQMRRGTGQGDLIWDRMPRDEQWEMFVRLLFRAQYTKKVFAPDDVEKLSKKEQAKRPTYTPQTLSEVLYEESQGITDLAVKIYMFAQERAIDTKKEVVTANIIRSVAKDKFGMLRDVLLALKYGNKEALARFEDVYPTAIKEYLSLLPEKSREELEVTGKAASSPDIKLVLDEAHKAKSSNASSLTFAQSHSTTVPTDNTVATKFIVSNTPDTTRTQVGPNKRTKGKTSNRGVLPGIIAVLESKEDRAAYEALQHASYIRPASEYLSN